MKMTSIFSKLPLHVFEALLRSFLDLWNTHAHQSPQQHQIKSQLMCFNIAEESVRQKIVNYISNIYLIQSENLSDQFLCALVDFLQRDGSAVSDGSNAIDLLAIDLAKKWSQKQFVRSISETTLKS